MPAKPKPESFVGYRCRFRSLWEHDILSAKTGSYGVVTFTVEGGATRTVQPDHLEHIDKLSPLPDALMPPVEPKKPEPKPTPPAKVKQAFERQNETVREVVRQAAAEVPLVGVATPGVATPGDILTADSVIPAGVEALFRSTPQAGVHEQPAPPAPPADAPPAFGLRRGRGRSGTAPLGRCPSGQRQHPRSPRHRAPGLD